MRSDKILISVCIPVYRTEKYLKECLVSVFQQDFEGFEIVLVNDASDGFDENGHGAKKIFAALKKENARNRKKQKLSPVPCTYYEHKNNLGTVETRRDLVSAASGRYIAMLDSDDLLLPGALKLLYEEAEKNSADIVHSYMQLNPASERAEKINAACSRPLLKNEILHDFLFRGHSGFLCGKLIKTELYHKAFLHIPFTKCVMADDLLIYFFIALEAEKYISVPLETYLYRMGLGVTGSSQITSLERWQHICSAANVFTVLFSEINRLPEGTLSEEELDCIRLRCCYYLKNNISQLKNCVAEPLQDEAYRMLCDYWGEAFVKEMMA